MVMMLSAALERAGCWSVAPVASWRSQAVRQAVRHEINTWSQLAIWKSVRQAGRQAVRQSGSQADRQAGR